VGQLLNLDLVVTGVDRLRNLWTVMGLAEARLMWRGASGSQEPQTDRQLVHEPIPLPSS
jgi:hypothetical protein